GPPPLLRRLAGRRRHPRRGRRHHPLDRHRPLGSHHPPGGPRMTPTLRYVASRLGQAVLVLFLAFTLAAVLLMILPGDGVLARFANPALGLSADQVEAIRASYGADAPWFVQYWQSLVGFLQGDFGFSVNSGAAVSTLITAA